MNCDARVTVATCPIPNFTKTPPKKIYGKNEIKNETTSKIKPSQQFCPDAIYNQPTFWQTSDRIWAKYGRHWWISCGSSHDTHSSGFNIETSNSHTFCKDTGPFPPLQKYMDHPMLHSHLSENLAMSSFLYVLTIYIFLYNKLAKKEVASSDVATKDHQD